LLKILSAIEFLSHAIKAALRSGTEESPLAVGWQMGGVAVAGEAGSSPSWLIGRQSPAKGIRYCSEKDS
jgi:hypothetical protein